MSMHLRVYHSGGTRFGLSGPSDEIVWTGETWVSRDAWRALRGAESAYYANVRSAINSLVGRARRGSITRVNYEAQKLVESASRPLSDQASAASVVNDAMRLAQIMGDKGFESDVTAAATSFSRSLSKIDTSAPAGAPSSNPGFGRGEGTSAAVFIAAYDNYEPLEPLGPDTGARVLPPSGDGDRGSGEDGSIFGGATSLGGHKLTMKTFVFLAWGISMLLGGLYVVDKALPR